MSVCSLAAHSADGWRNRMHVAVALVALLVAGGLHVAVAQEATQVASVEGITEYVLDNGLRVLLFPDASKPTTTVSITYFVGLHQMYGETGMAHLLEHLAFKGTPSHPDIWQELTEHGAQANGMTWPDHTFYYETFSATDENLEWAIDLEADRMVNSFIAAEDLESEMMVVRNESELDDNNPLVLLMQQTASTMYLWHKYGNTTGGARSDVEDLPIERLQEFYRWYYQRYYQPDNAMLVVAGRFDEERALELVVEKFGAIPRPDRTGANYIFPTYTREPTQDGERSVTLKRVGDVQLVMAGYHTPPGSHAHFPAIDVLAHALGDTPSGRLHEALVETGKAASVGTFAPQLKEAGVLLLFAQVREGDSLDEAWGIMRTTLDGVLERPITDEEVNRARASYLRNIELTFNSTVRIAAQLSEWEAVGDWRLFFIHRDRLEELTTEDVNLAVASYLKPSNRTVGFFMPTDQPDRAEIPVAPDVEALVSGYVGRELVAAGEVFDASPDNVEARTERHAFSSGFKVALLPKDNRGETVAVTFSIRFGTESSLSNKQTSGSLAAAMLMRGTTRRSREEISDEIDRLQAQISIRGSVTSASGKIETTRENLPEVLQLVREVLREPAFDPEEFEQLRQQSLARIEANRSSPLWRAPYALFRHMDPWPAGHPLYTATFEEQIEGLNAATLDEVRQFYTDFYGADRGHMAIVGDFDPDEVLPMVEETFGSWEASSPTERIPTVYRDISAERIVIETPDRANAAFYAGLNLPIGDDHPDYPALVLGNYMLGGGILKSRLATRIRGEEGLSYIVDSRLSGHPVDGNGQFTATATCAPENAERVEAAFREEIDRVLDAGYTADEVEAAKAGYLDSRGVSRSRDATLADTLSQGLYFNRTMQWQKEFEEKIATLTPEQILEAFRRYIDPDKITVVMAGDFAKGVVPDR